MGSHPINLAIRFILELIALVSAGLWGWVNGDGWLRFTYAISIPVTMAVIWGTFNVPGDPSRSGKAPIVIPGIIRLVIELLFFGFAVWFLNDIGYIILSYLLGMVVVVHYFVSYDRIRWLLSR
ncbi:YrdB family protein [Mangrovivirga sp. M17]|uniref:YrdB family protein n=1 Tax=Mangrovivirga halotolerans TaxID=2993936 RepID=A0ABT3RV12_9BACT|nr:YrdB family protein [Mangrovivirga halotolerans]MCX2745501.1 YrdB family protein [Mangrovivirga halotolerans]